MKRRNRNRQNIFCSQEVLYPAHFRKHINIKIRLRDTLAEHEQHIQSPRKHPFHDKYMNKVQFTIILFILFYSSIFAFNCKQNFHKNIFQPAAPCGISIERPVFPSGPPTSRGFDWGHDVFELGHNCFPR